MLFCECFESMLEYYKIIKFVRLNKNQQHIKNKL